MSNRRAQDERIEGTPDGVNAITAIMDLPDAPTIGTATAGVGNASVAFTPATTGGTPTLYTATSNPGAITGTSATSPITVNGLTAGTAYTFTVRGSNSTGTGPSSSASNSVTPVDLPGAYDALATVTLSSAAANVTFSGIPTGYKHLQIRGIVRNDTGATVTGFNFQLNGLSTTNYAFHRLRGNGTNVTSGASTSDNNMSIGEIPASSATASVFGGLVLDILDYANVNKNKTTRALFGHDANGSGTTWFSSGLYFGDTNAVSSIRFFCSVGNFVANSQFAIYGVK